MPDRSHEALHAVRAHLDEAHAAADRLVQEAQRQAEEAAGAGAPQVPPHGWEADPREAAAPDVHALLMLLEAVRQAVPAELSRQLAAALRELLLALRALIEWYLERLGEPAGGRPEVEVEDIPLD